MAHATHLYLGLSLGIPMRRTTIPTIWHPINEIKTLYFRMFKLIAMLTDLANSVMYGRDLVGNPDRIDRIEKEWAAIREMLERT